jgi:hypothetical protein
MQILRRFGHRLSRHSRTLSSQTDCLLRKSFIGEKKNYYCANAIRSIFCLSDVPRKGRQSLLVLRVRLSQAASQQPQEDLVLPRRRLRFCRQVWLKVIPRMPFELVVMLSGMLDCFYVIHSIDISNRSSIPRRPLIRCASLNGFLSNNG